MTCVRKKIKRTKLIHSILGSQHKIQKDVGKLRLTINKNNYIYIYIYMDSHAYEYQK